MLIDNLYICLFMKFHLRLYPCYIRLFIFIIELEELYTLESSSYLICILQAFSQYSEMLAYLIMDFDVQKFVILIKLSVSSENFFLMWHFYGNFIPNLQRYFLCFLQKFSSYGFIFSTMIHFQLTFMYGIQQRSKLFIMFLIFKTK